MALVALPFIADLPAANGTGRMFNVIMLGWCGAFMAWFRVHPPGAARAEAARAEVEVESVEDADLRTIRVEPATARRELDPVERARLRFRVRDEEPAPDPVDDRNG